MVRRRRQTGSASASGASARSSATSASVLQPRRAGCSRRSHSTSPSAATVVRVFSLRVSCSPPLSARTDSDRYPREQERTPRLVGVPPAPGPPLTTIVIVVGRIRARRVGVDTAPPTRPRLARRALRVARCHGARTGYERARMVDAAHAALPLCDRYVGHLPPLLIPSYSQITCLPCRWDTVRVRAPPESAAGKWDACEPGSDRQPRAAVRERRRDEGPRRGCEGVPTVAGEALGPPRRMGGRRPARSPTHAGRPAVGPSSSLLACSTPL